MSQLDNLEPKDPDEDKDYVVGWAKHLEGDTIFSSSWIIPDGITKFSESFTPSTAKVWLRGGTLGSNYEITNRIVTNNDPPRKLDQTITVRVRKR